MDTKKILLKTLIKNLLHKTDVVYPSIHQVKKILKKDKNIVFVGKLKCFKRL